MKKDFRNFLKEQEIKNLSLTEKKDFEKDERYFIWGGDAIAIPLKDSDEKCECKIYFTKDYLNDNFSKNEIEKAKLIYKDFSYENEYDDYYDIDEVLPIKKSEIDYKIETD